MSAVSTSSGNFRALILRSWISFLTRTVGALNFLTCSFVDQTSLEVGSWSQGCPSESRFFWRDDIFAMEKKLAIFRKDIHLRVRGARDRLSDFVKGRKELFQNSVEVSCTGLTLDASLTISFSVENNVELGNQRIMPP